MLASVRMPITCALSLDMRTIKCNKRYIISQFKKQEWMKNIISAKLADINIKLAALIAILFHSSISGEPVF